MFIKKVKGNTFLVETSFQSIPFYKLEGGKIIMVDCGLIEEREGILNLFSMEGLKPAAVLATHAHVDHIGNAAYFQKEFGARIIMNEVEAAVANSIRGLKTTYSTLAATDIMKHFGNMVVEADEKIGMHEDHVEVLGADFRIIAVPGHSPGHIAVLTPDNVACIGDTLASCDVLGSSRMMYSFSISKDLESKRSLMDLDADKFVLSHKGAFDEIRSIIPANIKYFEDSADEVLSLIETPVGFEELLDRVIRHKGTKVASLYKYNRMERMTRPLLEFLIDTGRLRCEIVDNRLYYVK
ncbi:MBL fold metallo-hydrolase [Youngiibacter multivorans]|uniref:Glyoxylase-like metal-dependent hydrolase (Beta-lactamase superfamily II) n=1 Tax=Youngiibacter multivorans TaxID=937251 RepID=A0ABS4G2Z1_9CLOT|nr:glyoxylase-like metal-dependent hydrolase (beta-lactamase superfamily II) [Youngiibacter multivorans]